KKAFINQTPKSITLLALVIRQYGEKKVKLVMGVDGGVENLEANLIAIKAVLTDAEMKKL
ncbi:hypothetical protein F8388_024054, partial [Cannabis sativa]